MLFENSVEINGVEKQEKKINGNAYNSICTMLSAGSSKHHLRPVGVALIVLVIVLVIVAAIVGLVYYKLKKKSKFNFILHISTLL
jgi:hypothetical protein